MKKLLLFCSLIVAVFANEGFTKEYKDFNKAVIAYKENVATYGNFIYFSQDKNGYHIRYDVDSKNEMDYSFLQIFSSKVFGETLTRYRQIEDKQDLYIKKFNNLYFLRMKNSDIEHTQKMFLQLKKRYPNMYYSKALKKAKVDKVEKTTHVVRFLKDKYKKIETNLTNDIVFSVKESTELPDFFNNDNIGFTRVNRPGNIDFINDIDFSVANFSLIRGDILGLKLRGAHGLTPFNNYGLLCSPSESVLYLVSKSNINSILDLRGKVVSTGVISDIAQIYLEKVASKAGILRDIRFKSLNVADSMAALESGKIDAFFLFESKEYIYEFLDRGLYISNLPRDFALAMNTKEGLTRFKYEIDDRLVSTYSAPNYIIAPLVSMDSDLIKKIEIVTLAFACQNNTKMPKAFFGMNHPEYINALASIREKERALIISRAEERRIRKEREALNVKLFKIEEEKESQTYYYVIENNSSMDANVTFLKIETKALDETSIKPHHLFKYDGRKFTSFVEKNSTKLISFTYKNPFTMKINDLPLDLIFRDHRYSDRLMDIHTHVGDQE
jgi:hypothetical protein